MKPEISPTIRDNLMKRWYDHKGIMPKDDTQSDETKVMFGFLAGVEYVHQQIQKTLLNIGED